MDNNTCNTIGIQFANELPVDNLSSTVDYFFGIRSVVDKDGQVVDQPVLVDGQSVIPNGTNANSFVLETNNPQLSVPEGQVLPCYLQNTGTTVMMMPADGTHPADFLVYQIDGNLARCQRSGVIVMGQPHEYKVYAAQYYLATASGQVTTSASQTGQKLFKPVSNNQLMVTM